MKYLAIAGLLLAATVAQASIGVSVNKSQETTVRVGMDASEVRQVLGRPGRIVTYGNAQGPSWNYEVVGTNGTVQFGIDFGPDGKVIAAREYWRPTSGG